ncbi:hypothetical protein [Hyphomonas johnsonii]|uniref:Uncharacterized protein n=1 Tax=Hyphomonas johnsonii MHS-2 TaxID=1280950 RepID=A0A059FK43_9PROT|nr:hypothetical protein [Hyphomonas johnsonii]KCZ90863.1 hypothetical protein HJO_13466 [Hyphomonas johnsonii MHS-2]
MAEIAARNAEAEKPAAVVDWRADVPTTASETLIGEWDMRVLSAYGHSPEKHNKLFITAMHDGLVEGHIWGGDGEGAFVDGRVREEDGKTILTFKTPQAGAGWWSRVYAGDWLYHEAVFENGRFTGEVRGEASSSTIGWYARSTNENDDMGAYLTRNNWMLRIVDTPKDFCRDTYRFFEDGTMTTSSGEELLKQTWRLETDEKGQHTLVKTVVSTNGLPDCQGNVLTKPGDVSSTAIVFRNGGGWMVCAGPDRGMSCYGTVDPYLNQAVRVKRDRTGH